MACVMWIMLCTTKYDFGCHSLESQTFNLQKRRNDGRDHRIIAVEDWTLGKEKKLRKFCTWNRRKLLKNLQKKKILNLKTRKCDNNFEKIFYLEKTVEIGSATEKILRKGFIENKKNLAP